ncbi:hypothetical protein HID58_031565, partial [Brassica napus]
QKGQIKPDTTLKQKPKRTNWATVQYNFGPQAQRENPLKKKSDSPHHVSGRPATNEHAAFNLLPEPARRHDGSPSTAKTNSRRTVQPEQSRPKLEPRSQMWQIYESTKSSTAYNRSSNLRLTCKEQQTSLLIYLSLKMQQPKRLGMKKPSEAGESDVEKTITSRRQKPAKTVLWKPPLPRSKAGRSSEELMQRRSPRPVGNTETGTQKQRTLSPLNQLITF